MTEISFFHILNDIIVIPSLIINIKEVNYIFLKILKTKEFVADFEASIFDIDNFKFEFKFQRLTMSVILFVRFLTQYICNKKIKRNKRSGLN